MALHLGTGLIETRGPIKLPKLQSAVESVLGELGYEMTYGGNAPPEVEPEDQATQFLLLDDGDGILGIQVALGDQVSDVLVVRDLARMVSERVQVPFVVFTTDGSLFGRRSVAVTCRKFEVNGNQVAELPVMTTHTAEVTDVEQNELRQAANALRQRIQGANDSLLTAEATNGLKVKKVLRYKRLPPKFKYTFPRVERLVQQLERCESFELAKEGDQSVVKLSMAGANTRSYLKADEADEFARALKDRPEIARRKKG